MTWLIDVETRKSLPALDTERRFLARIRERETRPRWVPVYEDGRIVRMVWVER